MSKSTESVPEKFRPLFRANISQGELKVRVIEATELPKSDPYCIIKNGKKSVKTRVVKSVENPFWEEEFLIDDILNPTKDILEIEIRDWNLLIKDSLIGSVEFPLCNLYKGFKSEFWFRVYGTKRGLIHVELTAINFGRDFPIPQLPPTGIEPQVPVEQIQVGVTFAPPGQTPGYYTANQVHLDNQNPEYPPIQNYYGQPQQQQQQPQQQQGIFNQPQGGGHHNYDGKKHHHHSAPES